MNFFIIIILIIANVTKHNQNCYKNSKNHDMKPIKDN